MANPEQVAKLREGVEAWNTWRVRNRGTLIDLSDANLAHTNLIGADFSGANLTRAKLQAATLLRANLEFADVRLANFNDANLCRTRFFQANMIEVSLSGANLAEAELDKADLSDAILMSANLTDSKLTGTNLGSAKLAWTTFANTNLAKTLGLDTCEHQAPCSIGIDTFLISEGSIPDVFLRGCGVPEQFITYARSLVTSPIEFYSCFISYSSPDEVFAERLNADLRAKNLRCWFAPEDLKIGDRFQERIEESIRLFDKVMIVLSDASMKSRWVEREVNAAVEREDREHRTILFPIRIDAAVMDAPQPWAADIRRSRHIGDFSGWKDHDSYQRGFERLLRDLEAKGGAAAQSA